MTEETTITTASQEKQQLQTYYCEVCGIDANPNTNLKRFGKLFCSDIHLDLYVRARQRKMGIVDEEEKPMRKRSRWFGGC